MQRWQQTIADYNKVPELSCSEHNNNVNDSDFNEFYNINEVCEVELEENQNKDDLNNSSNSHVSDSESNDENIESQDNLRINDYIHLDVGNNDSHDSDNKSDVVNDNDKRNELNRESARVLEMLYEGSDISDVKSVSHLMDLYIQEKIRKATLKCILETLQLLLPNSNNMPKTIYQLFKFVKKRAPLCGTVKHYYCDKCLLYWSRKETQQEKNAKLIRKTCFACYNTKITSCFYEFDIEDQIRYLFEHKNLAEDLKPFDSHRNENVTEDLTDGSEYIRANTRKHRKAYDLTLILNTDGISLVKSSKSNCWPLMMMIAELPKHLREFFLIPVGLWYNNKHKPLMNTFLLPFCEKFNYYFQQGIRWTHPNTNEVYISKIVVPLFIADAPARAQIQNILNFNGKYGCNICEIKTKRCKPAVGKKIIRIYAFPQKQIKLRAAKQMEDQAERVLIEKKRHIKGVKDYAVVSALPLLDLSSSVLPEYMHSVLLGIGKQFIDIWFHKTGAWNVVQYLREIDNLLINIRPPHSFHRMPRSISFSSFYKASEIYYWILYYSVPILSNFLPDKYFQHWLLLVIAIFILLQNNIAIESELKEAEICLQLFVKDIAVLYGDRELTYNMHQLLHLGLCVRRWDLLWATSAFPFESFNGFLANCVHGTKNMSQEIINFLTIAQGAAILRNQCLVGEHPTNHHPSNIKKDYELLGSTKELILMNDIERRLLTLNGLFIENLSIYARAKIKNELYTSQLYKIPKNDSSNVQVTTTDNKTKYGFIRFFFEIDNNLYFIFQCYNVTFTKMFVHRQTASKIKHIIPIEDINKFVLIKVQNVRSLIILIRVGNYLCKCPNNFNKNF